MKSWKHAIAGAALAALTLVPASALADGLAVKTSQLPSEVRTGLAAEIAAHRKASPGVFSAVRDVSGHRPETYKRFRNPKPNTVRELRALGAPALLPLLEALAFEAPADRAQLAPAEARALTVGMLEAVGALRDPRSAPVLLAVFADRGNDFEVLASAARGLGRLGGDAELALLTSAAVPGDARMLAAIEGLGACRRMEAAKHLASLLSVSRDERTTLAAAQALGTVGSSLGWKALGAQRAAEGLAVRQVVAEELTQAYPRTTGEARRQVLRSLGMTAHPSTLQMIDRARAKASPAHADLLDELRGRIEKKLAR